MDIEKLIERLRKEAYGSDIEDLLLEAATALSTLQAENERLWETPTVTWWRPLPDPPEKKKEDLTCRRS